MTRLKSYPRKAPRGTSRGQMGDDERKKIAKSWNLEGLNIHQKKGMRRAIQKIVRRRHKRYNLKESLSKDDIVLTLRHRRQSPLLDFLFPERNKKDGWLKIAERKKRSASTLSLKNFSLLDNPEDTLVALQKIAKAEARSIDVTINFEDGYCLDVVPFMLLMEAWEHMLPVFAGGKMDVPLQKVLVSLGITQAMGIKVNAVEGLEDIWAFPLRRRRAAGSTVSKTAQTDAQTREVVNDQFCDSVNEWLREAGLQLTDMGTGWIKTILGELLENAERHSDGQRQDGAWSIAACMVRRKTSQSEWRLQVFIGIVGLGDTFSESLKRAAEDTRSNLDSYVSKMKKKGAEQSEDTLRTLAALQDTITCVASADSSGRGGYGLQEMLELVNFLGISLDPNRQPRVTIISGKSCIQLRSPYILGERTQGVTSPRVLWCNQTNSSDSTPDKLYVYDMTTGLPGTSISIGFDLDQQYFDQVLSGNKDNE